MKSTHARRFILLLIVLIGLSAFGFVVWPRGSGLEPFTTAPLTIAGKSVRLQALVPTGWEVVEGIFIESGVMIQYKNQWENSVVHVKLQPADWGKWVPEWIRSRLIRGPEPGASVTLTFCVLPAGSNKDVRTKVSFDKTEGAKATRQERDCFISYHRTNRDEFEATYRQICQSFKVIK